MKNKRKFVYMLVGVATLLVAVIGVTYSYFSIGVNGNNTASSINITTEMLGNVIYDGASDEILVDRVYTGWSATKSFMISSADDLDNSVEIEYQIQLVVADGSLATASINNDFRYSLTGTDNFNGGTLVSKTNTNMPSTTTLIGTGKLKGTETHSYTMTVELQEFGINQNYLQGHGYSARIQVNVKSGNNMRTWNTATNSWTSYTN